MPAKSGECLEELRSTVPCRFAKEVERERLKTAGNAHVVHGAPEIGRGIDERSVKVEKKEAGDHDFLFSHKGKPLPVDRGFVAISLQMHGASEEDYMAGREPTTSTTARRLGCRQSTSARKFLI